jgi:hypothetical protein
MHFDAIRGDTIRALLIFGSYIVEWVRPHVPLLLEME